MSDTDNVIDLTAVRLRRMAELPDYDTNPDVTWALLNLYQQGAIEVTWVAGEPCFVLREGFEEGLYEATEGPSPEGL